jgi:HEPN domain-containing protein
VEILSGSDRAADAVVGFHAQQAVEKFVKAVLTVRGIDVPRTHDLRFLLDGAGAAGVQVPDAVRASLWLTPWSVEFRYGDDLDDLLDRATAADTLTAVGAWAEGIVAGG